MRARGFTYFAIGLLTGLAAGILTGLLLAPYSGVQTRRRLAQLSQQVADTARDVADRAEQTATFLGEKVDRYLGHDEEAAWRRIREIREGVERYSHTQTS